MFHLHCGYPFVSALTDWRMDMKPHMVGEKIGRWTVISEPEQRKGNTYGNVVPHQQCECDCGLSKPQWKTVRSLWGIKSGQYSAKGCSKCSGQEKKLQAEVVRYCLENKDRWPQLGGVYAILAQPNQTPGFKKGMPDLGFFGSNLFIELKASEGKLSTDQEKTHTEMRNLGCDVYVLKSLKEAIHCITTYFQISENQAS